MLCHDNCKGSCLFFHTYYLLSLDGWAGLTGLTGLTDWVDLGELSFRDDDEQDV